MDTILVTLENAQIQLQLHLRTYENELLVRAAVSDGSTATDT